MLTRAMQPKFLWPKQAVGDSGKHSLQIFIPRYMSFVLITHKNPRLMSLLTLLLTNSTFWSYSLKHSEENYLQYVHVLTFWFMLRWLFIQPYKTNIAMWRTSLISTPQIMNGKCSQWTVPKYSEDWETNTGEVFYDFSYLRNCLFCYQGRKVFSAIYQLEQ